MGWSGEMSGKSPACHTSAKSARCSAFCLSKMPRCFRSGLSLGGPQCCHAGCTTATPQHEMWHAKECLRTLLSLHLRQRPAHCNGQTASTCPELSVGSGRCQGTEPSSHPWAGRLFLNWIRQISAGLRNCTGSICKLASATNSGHLP